MPNEVASRQSAQSPQDSHLPIVFWGLMVLTTAVRLIGISRPLLGNFATKNVVYAMIARNWAEGRSGLCYPMLDCLRDGQRSLHMVEFPVAAYLTGWLWKLFGGSLDIWGRATSVAFSLAAVALLFLFVRRRHGTTAALGAGFVLALAPVSVTYGQSFMLEPSLAALSLATFYCLDRWLLAERSAWLVLAAICLALLLLTKIYMLVLLLPLGVMVVCPRAPDAGPHAGRSLRRRCLLALAATGLAILPAVLWYTHAIRAASPGSPLAARIFYSVRQSAAVHRPPSPLLWSADFYRQVFDDLSGVVLTPVAFMLAAAGFLDRAWRQHAGWLLAMLLLVAALPLKFYEMNYYYMAVLPLLAVLAGLGWQVIHHRVKPGPSAVTALLLLGLAVSLRYTAKPAFTTPDEDRAVLAAAATMQTLCAEGEPVVTMHGWTIDLLYYCNRAGWAIAPQTPHLERVLADCRRQGARYLVVAGAAAGTSNSPAAVATLPVAAGGDGFRIHRLADDGR